MFADGPDDGRPPDWPVYFQDEDFTMRFKPLNLGQSLGWAIASLVFGVCQVVVYFALGPGASGDSDAVSVGVFFAIWLVVTLLVRLYIQDKDPTNFYSILGIKQGNKRECE
jgi:hypothetical protein